MNAIVSKPVKEGNQIFLNEPLAATLEGRRAQMARAKAINAKYHLNVVIGFPPSVVREQRAAARAAKLSAPPADLPPVEAYADSDVPPWVE